MKNAINVDGVELKFNNVLVQLMRIPNLTGNSAIKHKNDAFFGEKEVYYMGKIIDVGPDAVTVKKGEYVLFSMLSGYAVYTESDLTKKSIKDYYKVIEETGLVIHSKMSGMKVENVASVGDQIIVDTKEVKKQLKSKSGVVMTEKSEDDPRQKDIDRGVIVYLSKEAELMGYEVGDKVYFEKGRGLTLDELKGSGEYVVITPRYVLFKYNE